MVHRAPGLPHGHGEVLASPAYDRWADLMASNATLAEGWRFDVGGMPASELRSQARAESLAVAASFSERLGVNVAHVRDPRHIVMTGHQPEFYHPGVWIKVFLLQRLADETGAAAIDLVVDSDTFETLEITAPCLHRGSLQRCSTQLADAERDTCFACAPPPTVDEVEGFSAKGARVLRALPTWAVLRHFMEFCDALRSARIQARNLAEAMTFARRMYESVAATDYLELPVTGQSNTEAFLRFFLHIAIHAERFVADYNAELASFRMETKTRSSAQPFPELQRREGMLELPFWHIEGARRSPVWIRPGAEIEIHAEDALLARVPSDATDVAALADVPGVLAPKAAALTMFARMFVADLFVHGVGGGRYDRVTDGIIRRFFGVEPPRFCVASMTMYLPLGGFFVSKEDLADAEERLHRLQYNPDQMLHEVEFESEEERARAHALAEEKRELVDRISMPEAEKKSLGGRIREVNGELSEMLAPFGDELRAERDRLASLLQASEVITDRTYPFCFWSPLEIQDQAR